MLTVVFSQDMLESYVYRLDSSWCNYGYKRFALLWPPV